MPEVKNKNSLKAIDGQRPFLGLRSFEEKNKSQFGGRDQEIKELFGLDENSVLTVIFGKSGIGKTSLIKAGLIPELQQNFYFPIYIRIDYSTTRTPLEQVKKMVYDKMKERDSSVNEIGDATLWEYFHNVNLLDDLFTPVLILDQFEEIFTLGDGKVNVQELLIQLADLAENRIPLKVQGEYQRLNKTVPSHYAEHPYRVVLSLREDYLARLEELKKYMPSIMNSRFRVVQMTALKAMDAAIKPGKGLIDKRVAKEIIKKMPGVTKSDFDASAKNEPGRSKLKVEPFLLSLICDRINEKRIEKKLKKITIDLVSDFNVTDVIYSFYSETITHYGENVERAIENCLLTEGGFRKLQVLEEFQRQYDISDEVVDQLVDARILRKEIRDGVDYVELIHDVLAPIIKGKRSKRARIAREKEKDAIIEGAKRQRARLIKTMATIAIAVVAVLATISWLAYNIDEQKSNIEQHNKKMALARSLLLTSQSVGFVDGDTKKAALIARLAYLIYNNNKNSESGENMYSAEFYNAMYKILKKDGFPFDQSESGRKILFAVEANENERYIGLEDGTVLITYPTLDLTDSIVYKFDKALIAVMDFYSADGENLLAIAGTSDSVTIHNMNVDGTTRRIAIPDSNQKLMSLAFTNEGELILLSENSIVGWDNSYKNPWKVNFSADHIVTAINYHPYKDSIIIGNNRGEIFTMSVKDTVKVSKPIAHISKVTDIAISPNGKLIATASADNSVVIWNQESWTTLPITAKALNSTHGFVNSVSFTPDGDYILAGYADGAVLRWPVSLEKMAQIICNYTDGDLTDAEWKKYTKNLIDDKQEYSCK